MKPKYYHPTLSLIESADWQVADLGSTAFSDVLNHQGLLTDQLKKIAKKDIYVECLSQKYDSNNTTQRRDVVIYMDDIPRVLASTILPANVLQQYPALLTLGNNPIGEHLESQYGAKRVKPEYRTVTDDDELNFNFNETGVCYLRKYVYELEYGEITIVELFSPQILLLLDELLKTKHS